MGRDGGDKAGRKLVLTAQTANAGLRFNDSHAMTQLGQIDRRH